MSPGCSGRATLIPTTVENELSPRFIRIAVSQFHCIPRTSRMQEFREAIACLKDALVLSLFIVNPWIKVLRTLSHCDYPGGIAPAHHTHKSEWCGL